MTPGNHVVLVAPTPPPYGGMALQAGQLRRRLEGDGISVTLVSASPPPGRWPRLERIPLLRTLLRAARVARAVWREAGSAAVVHILAASWVYFFAVVYPAVAIARLRKARVILNYRGGEAGRFLHWFGWLSGPVFSLPHVITTPSEFLAQTIGRRFRKPVTIVPNIIDTSRFQYRARTVFQPKLLVARHLERMYGVETVLRAFRAVQREHPEASLWIAGSGPEAARLRELAAEWKLNNVRFFGHISHEELPALYAQCDFFVNGSLVDNFPGALVEASAAGLVVVSTAAGGIPFLYQHGKTALLVPPGDAEGLAREVNAALGSPALCARLTREAEAMVRCFEWPRIRLPLYRAYGFEPPRLAPAAADPVEAETLRTRQA